jgi:hypothetical protein
MIPAHLKTAGIHAVDLSSYGDTVIALQGVYYENPVLFDKSIILASIFIFSQDTLDIQNTIIDGDSLETVIWLMGCDSTVQITGLTLRHGLGQGVSNHTVAGGIGCESADVTISDNRIIYNVGPDYGGGIYSRNSSIRVINNFISNNVGYVGGAIYCGYGHVNLRKTRLQIIHQQE